MPRPGPRPYECIRRAWHSDTHQPLRGTLIHEIFRMVNEIHSISTRRKKEWQEKLPIVVLRAEEILYSKANSEREYADVETLRSRLDDAVNTMIRREDSEEEGVYLVPCVEAALSLGCTPKKGHRGGQRQGSSRHLLNAANWVSPAARPAGNEDCTIGPINMDPSCCPPENCSSSTFGSMAQTQLLLQEQDLQSMSSYTSNAFFSPPGVFAGPSTCYPLTTTSSISSQSPSFLKALGAHQPFGTPLYPKQGMFVQFLRAANVSRVPDVQPLDAAVYASPQKSFNVAQELRPPEADSPGARTVGSGLLHGYAGTYSSGSLPSHTIMGLPTWAMCGDGHQYTPSLGAATASLHSPTSHLVQHACFYEKGMNLQSKECTPAEVSGPVGSLLSNAQLPTLLTRCNRVPTGAERSTPTNVSMAVVDEGSALLHGDHDLQLRLGPPVNKPSVMPVSVADTSAPKRMRVDTLDPSSFKNPL